MPQVRPLLLCTLCVSPLLLTGPAVGQSPSAPPQVTIALTSHRFTPSPILLKAGQPVRLVFQNQAGKSHDFTAPRFFASSRILAGEVRNGRVSLRAGASATVDLIPAAGSYNVDCSKFLHATMGMRTQIVVQ